MSKKLTYLDVKNFIEVESGSGCKLLSENYINARSNLLVKCACGIDFYTTFDRFKGKNKRQCNECSSKKINVNTALSYEFVKNFIEVSSGSNCKLLDSEYKNYNSPLRLLCSCGSEFYASFASFKTKNKRHCNNCGYKKTGDKLIKHHNVFINQVYNLVQEEYTVISEYSGTKNKIKFRHNSNSCNNAIFDMTPDNFLQGQRCPICNESKGAQTIRKWLTLNNIEYKLEYFFDDLMGELKPLRFDFAVFNNGELFLLIEFDHAQHFIWQKGWQTKEEFLRQQKYDELKNIYCKNNNLQLLRISYLDTDNIDKILKDNLAEII